MSHVRVHSICARLGTVVIVADTNLIVYYLVNGPQTHPAAKVFDHDSVWISPLIWQTELLNVLATVVREGHLDFDRATDIYIHAPAFIKDADVPAMEVLELSVSSRFATFDCYYVVLARKLGLKLATADKKLLQTFPDVAISIEDFGA